MGGRADYDVLSRVYDAGRAMPEEWVAEWRSALTPYLGGMTGHVTDVGSGTGIWAAFIAKWFYVSVIGIEPSTGMRERAGMDRKDPRIAYVGGEAEHLPLSDGSCTALWMSTVVHHVPNLEAAAHEARRVLQDDAPVLIRQGFSGRLEGVLWTRFFPSALKLAEQRQITVESVIETFAMAGFKYENLEPVTEIAAIDLQAYAKKTATRADSCLAAIPDDEFEVGLEALRRAASDADIAPVTATLDLLVLR